MSEERRSSIRVTRKLPPSDFKIQKNQVFTPSFYAEVIDISLTGVRLAAPHLIPLGEKILVSITLPTNGVPKFKTFKMEVCVTRVSTVQKLGKFEVGGKFLEISEEAKSAIHSFYLS